MSSVGTPQVGATLGGYRLVEEIGEGATASVFRAEDARGAVFSLKVLHAFHLGNERLRERFRRESRLIAELAHPNIIPFRGYYEADGQVFYVMDFYPHRTVESLLEEKGRLEVPLAASILVDVASALAYAHARKVVHRDLKPENLFYLPEDGRTVLADFGLAKPLDEVPITADGARMMGTPHYMAPEQVEGEPTTGLTDVYQAGVLLFHLVTGRLPFVDENPYKAVMKRLEDEPAFTPEEDAALPIDLREIILHAMARDPGARLPGAAVLGAALLAFVDPEE